MPVTPTYPGVYIEEIPSGVRTITGVATSITAFVGRAWKGPVNDPVTVSSFGEYTRVFGGLWVDSPMSYAVRDFFAGGGNLAVIVRLVNGASAASLTIGGLGLAAADEGTWADGLRARVDHDVSADVATGLGLTAGDLFNLSVRDTVTGDTEQFLNVSVAESARRVDRVLQHQSRLAQVSGNLPGGIPGASDDGLSADDLKTDPFGDVRSTGVGTQGSDGDPLTANDYADPNLEADKHGIWALEGADLFNLLCIPPVTRDGDTPDTVYQAALAYCVQRRAMLIVDPQAAMATASARSDVDALNLSGTDARNAAIYFPRVIQADPQRQGQLDTFVPCGLVAGVMARTDAQRGVWKAPAGLDAALAGIQGLAVGITDAESGSLNQLGINALRSFPGLGRVVWGARTMRGADRLADEYKYIPVRRLALYIEESLYRGTQWVVFEPNDEPLWAQIRLNVGAFMHELFRQGAFQGQSPRDAYFVKCDSETTTQTDRDLGMVNILVGFAPLKPAEFVIIQIQQMAGQIQA